MHYLSVTLERGLFLFCSVERQGVLSSLVGPSRLWTMPEILRSSVINLLQLEPYLSQIPPKASAEGNGDKTHITHISEGAQSVGYAETRTVNKTEFSPCYTPEE